MDELAVEWRGEDDSIVWQPRKADGTRLAHYRKVTPSYIQENKGWVDGTPWVHNPREWSAVVYKSKARAEKVALKAMKRDALLKGITYTEVK